MTRQAAAGASLPPWVRQKMTPAPAEAAPPLPSRAPLPPSPRETTNHVAGAARANEEERERAKWRKFSTEEDETLRKARTQPGWTWKGIASQLPGRSEQVAHDRWRLLQRGQAEVAPPSSKRWSAQEDATIREARTQPGWTWKGIASQLPGRTEKTAYMRWRHLQRGQSEVAPPSSKHWSAQEDATLRKARGQPGWTWKGIKSQLPGRTEKAAFQ